MADQDAVSARKAAAAAGAADNSDVGVDGDGPSAADRSSDGPGVPAESDTGFEAAAGPDKSQGPTDQ